MTVDENRPIARTLQAMKHVRVLLLLGEASAGKTVALIQEAERLRAAGQPVEIADLADGLCDVLELLKMAGGDIDLTIFVDCLDVGFIRDPALDGGLRRALTALACSHGARLRLALRSGFAAQELTACLETLFGGDFEHLTLAPLRSEDVRRAATAEAIDPDTFVEALKELQVVPLAARPPTLRMLLRLWAEHGRLPKRRQDLYQQGCEVLLREANPTRLDARGGDDADYAGRLELPKRFAVAARLAALMTFGNHDHLDMRADPSGLGLHVDAVTGGLELSPSGDTAVTRRAVREVVGSSLFRPAGPRGFAFSHRSFMHFLGAAFVTVRKDTPHQILPLLSAPDGRIGANRIEVASWLSALVPAYFDHPVVADPQVIRGERLL